MYCITKQWFQFYLSFHCWSFKVYFWCSEISKNKTNGIDLCWWRHKCNKWGSMRDVNSSFSGPECNKLFAGATTHACRWKEWEEIYQWRGRERGGRGEKVQHHHKVQPGAGIQACRPVLDQRLCGLLKRLQQIPPTEQQNWWGLGAFYPPDLPPNLICISNITWVCLIDQNQSE